MEPISGYLETLNSREIQGLQGRTRLQCAGAKAFSRPSLRDCKRPQTRPTCTPPRHDRTQQQKTWCCLPFQAGSRSELGYLSVCIYLGQNPDVGFLILGSGASRSERKLAGAIIVVACMKQLCTCCGKERAVLRRPKTQEQVRATSCDVLTAELPTFQVPVPYNVGRFMQLCRGCFYHKFEEEIHETIVKHNLFTKGERVAIGASGVPVLAATHTRFLPMVLVSTAKPSTLLQAARTPQCWHIY